MTDVNVIKHSNKMLNSKYPILGKPLTWFGGCLVLLWCFVICELRTQWILLALLDVSNLTIQFRCKLSSYYLLVSVVRSLVIRQLIRKPIKYRIFYTDFLYQGDLCVIFKCYYYISLCF